MPRIHDQYTHCAVYIYGSLVDAANGEHYGGSGFLCHVPLKENPQWGSVYVVTNWHVIEAAKTPVIRFNRKDGRVESIPTKLEDWFRHPDGDDVAVLPLDIDYETLHVLSIGIEQFVTPQLIVDEDIGIGDDTVMIGRFVNHEGKQRNSPAVRFGNIAMMAHEKIQMESGLEQEAFLVEVRSLPGYSGSAVVIYSPCAMNDMSIRRSGKTRSEDEAEREKEKQEKGMLIPPYPIRFTNAKGPFLLGVDFCHIHRKATVRERNEAKSQEGWFIKENTGMAGVIPAWKIAEILNGEELETMRREDDRKLTEKRKKSAASLDSVDEDSPRRVFSKQDFEQALKRASRRLPASKSGKERK